jgi:putative transposase
MPSYSRPSVSNDNPYSESLFRILRYRPEYPENGFADLQGARTWVTGFVDWYNTQHLHSAIKLVNPQQRYFGDDTEILANRKSVYLQAKAKNPIRWSGGIRNWDPITEVHLNPEKKENEAG